MKKIYKQIIIAFILISLLLTFLPIIPYKPIIVKYVGRDIKFFKDKFLATTKHLNRVELVLNFHDETFWRFSPNKLLIRPTLYLNNELIWNYTTKAEDLDWIKSHSQ